MTNSPRKITLLELFYLVDQEVELELASSEGHNHTCRDCALDRVLSKLLNSEVQVVDDEDDDVTIVTTKSLTWGSSATMIYGFVLPRYLRRRATEVAKKLL
jgi:hypothetical protein